MGHSPVKAAFFNVGSTTNANASGQLAIADAIVGSTNFRGDTVTIKQLTNPSQIFPNGPTSTLINSPGNIDNDPGGIGYIVDFQTASGTKTLYSASSTSLPIVDKTVAGQVLVGAIPQPVDPELIYINIYRYTHNIGQYRKLAQVAAGTTTYIDNIADSGLDPSQLPAPNNTGSLVIDNVLWVKGRLDVNFIGTGPTIDGDTTILGGLQVNADLTTVGSIYGDGIFSNTFTPLLILGNQATVVIDGSNTIPSAANAMIINATGQLNAIDITGPPSINGGTIFYLQCLSGVTVTVKHNTAGGAGSAKFNLAGSTDFVMAPYSTLTVQYDGISAFQEMSRKSP